MIIAKDLRREVKNWFGSLEPHLFVTHNFGFCVSPETGERSMRRFYNRLQSRCTVGTGTGVIPTSRWSQSASGSTSISNPHCHVLISASDAESAWLFEEGNKSWLWLQPRGEFDIGEIEAPRKAISYITKEIYKPDSQDQLFVYKAPPSNSANSNSVEPTSNRIDLAAVHRHLLPE